MINKSKVIAYYLPQYHPIPENNKWWGNGFTEWTNVGKAKPLFKGHYQPRVPADLGYYDLRLPDVRQAQADLAKKAGVTAFCYWLYWFGKDKELLEMPLNEVVRLGKPDFPFCIAWANHSWERKRWNADANKLSKTLLIEQEYQGSEEIDAHFFRLLNTFKDNRYYKIKGKLVFVIYNPNEIPYLETFIERWQILASKNNLPGFYFIGHAFSKNNLKEKNYQMLDAINLVLLSSSLNLVSRSLRGLFSLLLNKPLSILKYSAAIQKMVDTIFLKENVYPTIIPNWDASPRLGSGALILNKSTPELFYNHVKELLKLVENKKEEDKIIFLKSWNEWAEGNYMEPDIKYGDGYIKALANALADECK